MTPNHTSHDDPALQELRKILFADESKRLDAIEALLHQPELHAKEVARILADAVRLSSEQGSKLGDALRPAVESAITASIAQNPKPLSDALFPVMGPAIRKAIQHSIASMLQSLNQTLEHSFSIQGLRWRWDAWRTGKPFAEIVLLNTLVYRVEQVFLIHKETGLLLHHISFDPTLNEDADVISSMLTAVRDFIQDSFSSEANMAAQNFRLGDLEIMIEQSPDMVLALVCRGNPPQHLHHDMEQALEHIQQSFHQALQDFQGDTSPFDACHDTLSAFLQADYSHQHGESSSKKPLVIAATALLLVLGAGAWSIYQKEQTQARWDTYIEQLQHTPGLILTQVSHTGDDYHITGLRDPLAPDPASLLANARLDASHITYDFRPYQSMEDIFLLQRVKQRLHPPKHVQLSIRNHTLMVSGTALKPWVTQVHRALWIPGIEAVDTRKLTITSPTLSQIRTWLEPPASIQVQLSGSELTLTGQATQSWLARAANIIQQHPIITAYHDEQVVRTDSDEQLLKYATSVLHPPHGVHLSMTANHTLLIEGQASQRWIQQARRKVKQLTRIQHVDMKQLQASESLLLQRAIRTLQPPASVSLDISGSTLIAQGEASSSWIAQTEQQAKHIRGITAYRSQLKVIFSDDELLQAAIVRLQPPASIHLRVAQGVLTVEGRALQTWLTQAQAQAGDIQGIQSVHMKASVIPSENDILQQAIHTLQPPASVHLSLNHGVLSAQGTAPQTWMKQARQKALHIPGVSQWQGSQLKVAISPWQAIQKQVQALTLASSDETPILNSKDRKQLKILADLYESARQLHPKTRLHIQATYTNKTDLVMRIRLQNITDTLKVYTLESRQIKQTSMLGGRTHIHFSLTRKLP